MDNARLKWKIATKLNHPKEVILNEGNRPLIQPIYQSAKFTPSENFPYWEQFIYSRISNPTVKQLEESLAEIQNRQDCLVVASGIAALTGTFLTFLSAGDHIISFRELYKPARTYIRDFLPKYQIESTIISLSQTDRLEDFIQAGKTKIIHFESPTNPNLKIANIDKILSIAKKHNILVTMDGTFAGLHQHTDYQVDLMIHSLTKFANGHGDVIAGSIAGSRSLINKIRHMSIYLGATLDPGAAHLIGRGLKTYLLRFEKQAETAAKIATFLNEHPLVERVYYPGLESHSDHHLAKKQMSSMGSVIAFEVNKSVAFSADKFCYQLKLIQLAASIGSTESIICPTDSFFGDDLSEEEKNEVGISRHSLRLSVGLEDADDLINDLNTALGRR